MRNLIKRTPIPVAGLALGVIALGGLLKGIAPIAYWVCFALAVALVALVIARAIMFTADVRADMHNPMMASTSGTLWMALMQISIGIFAFAPQAAFVVWLIAVAGHTVLIVWFTATFAFHFQWKQLMPSWFIVYVGIIMVSATAPTFGLIAFAQVMFWIGMALCVVLLVLVARRMLTMPLPEPALPMVCIFAAPFSLGLSDYLAVSAQPNMAFVYTMIAVAQVLYFVVLFQVPRLVALLHRQFFPSVAAMTFPFAISAVALTRLLGFLAKSGVAYPSVFDWLAVAESVVAVVLVVWVLVRYLMFFADTAKPEQAGNAR